MDADPAGPSGERPAGIGAAPGYSRVAIWLHWLIAALVLVNLLLGFYHEDFGKTATPWLMFFHKSIGITVLVLTMVRVLWRLFHSPPPFDALVRKWEAGLARLIHISFYVALLALPLSGWALSSSGGRDSSFFGLFHIGLLPVPRSEHAHDIFLGMHEAVGKLMIGLILLHLAGAARHHLQGHGHLLGRMAPWASRAG
jgi:cytochrome b561